MGVCTFTRANKFFAKTFKTCANDALTRNADSLGIFFFPASNFSLSIIPYHPSTKCGYNLFLEVTLWLFMR